MLRVLKHIFDIKKRKICYRSFITTHSDMYVPCFMVTRLDMLRVLLGHVELDP